MTAIKRSAVMQIAGKLFLARQTMRKQINKNDLAGIGLFDPSLFPGGGTWTGSPTDFFNNNKTVSSIDDLLNLVLFRKQAELALAQFFNSAVPLEKSDLDYSEYFQWPNNPVMQRIVNKYIDPSWSDDYKAYVIERLVIDKIKYVEDIKQYHENEYWALPTETWANKKGDCEDGAFLIVSLMLHAGVDPKKIFFYGGAVRMDGSLKLFGHGWVGYKRSDGEMIPLDWCFYPTDAPLDERTPLKDNHRYYEDYFVATVYKTVETEYANWVRNPDDIKAIRLAIRNRVKSARALALNNINSINQRSHLVASRVNNNFRVNKS